MIKFSLCQIYVERKKVSNMQIFFIDINHSHIHNYKDDVKHFEYISHYFNLK